LAIDYWTPAVLDPAYKLGLVESYFLKLNDPSGKWAAWIKYTFLIRRGGGEPLPECWFIFFDRDAVTGRKVSAWKQVLSNKDWRIGEADAAIFMGDNTLTRDRASGTLGGGEARWDFGFSALSNSMIVSPSFSKTPLLPTTKLTSPVPEGLATGELTVGKKRFQFADYPLSVGHNWGHFHSTAYTWAQARMLGEGSGRKFFFEGASLSLGSRHLTLGKVLLDGEEISFAGPQCWLRAKADVSVGHWQFTMQNREWVLNGEFDAEPEYVAGLKYVQPNGRVKSCLNSMISNGNFQLSRRRKGGSSFTFTVDGTAALEHLTPGLSQQFEMLA